MENKKSEFNDFFDSAILPLVIQLPPSDKVRLSKFLFGAFSNTAVNYYHQLGMSEQEISSLIEMEHQKIKEILLNHLGKFEENQKLESEDFEYRFIPMDDSFVSDATIDINLLIKEVSGGGV